jgi:YD repeat-containing protein
LVEQAYDTQWRPTVLSAKNGAATLTSSTAGYDTGNRLSTVTDGSFSATYGYLANSPLVEKIDFRQSSTVRMTTTRKFDNLNRLGWISSWSSAGAASSSSYLYNSANQRTRLTNEEGAYWEYAYDSLGQVQSGKKRWANEALVPGMQFEYGHDDTRPVKYFAAKLPHTFVKQRTMAAAIDWNRLFHGVNNRTSAKTGGDANGASLRTATYTRNDLNLNQYTNRTNPGYAQITGITHAEATVTANSGSTYRHNEYFRREITVSNSSAPQYPSITVSSILGGSNTSRTGNVFVPQASESYGPDLDGNLTGDGRSGLFAMLLSIEQGILDIA